jgi:hypothetical protein
MTKWGLTVTLLLASCAVAQQAPRTLRGNWSATAGPNQVLRGRWLARVLPDTPNTARGSWTLLNKRNQVVLQGTWAARKSARGWYGTWAARIPNGRSVSGKWKAEMATSNCKTCKTFEDMLKQATEEQIFGSWQSGPARGNWRLQR